MAQAFSSAKTKTTCIVKGALAPSFLNPVIEMCRGGPFSILCDEGNDSEDKNLAILVRMWDSNLGKPMTRFFAMPVCNIGTAEMLFQHIDSALATNGVSWSNVVGLESDTTNAMVGKRNSVLSRVKTKQPKVFSLGCVCHLANLCLLAGAKALPIDIDDFFVDLYYYFDKSAKRKEVYREFQEFTGVQALKIVKHCKTRWLSLERAVKRVLQQWDALHAYFDKEAETDRSARVLRLDGHLRSELTKLVFLFLEFALDALCKFNAVFQSSLPMLPSLQSEVTRLLNIFLARFLAHEAIRAVQDDLTTIDLNDPTIQVCDDNLSIGHKTWALLTEIDVDPAMKNVFFRGVRNFYKGVSAKIINKFTFDDHVLNDLVIVLPENQSSISSATVLRMARRFPAAVPEEELDELEHEVLDYMLMPPHQLPVVQHDNETTVNSEEICRYWHKIGSMETLDGSLRFQNLANLAKCLLALPHSNADTERVFSIVRKIVTDYRIEMEQSTLCALLACKLNSDCCYKLSTPTELLHKAKRATTEYNKAHCSKC